MPSKKSTERDSWMTAPVPQTPLQRGSYIEQCTKWIVSEPEADAATASEFQQFTLPPSGMGSALTSTSDLADDAFSTSFTDAEARFLQHRRCVVCHSIDDVRVVLANPFTIRCYVGMCGTCSGTCSSASGRLHDRIHDRTSRSQ